MRLDTSKRYLLGGFAEPVKVERIWDDDDEHDRLSHITINGEHYRVDWFASTGWGHCCWIVTRLSSEYNCRAKELHNVREDCTTYEVGAKAWIVDEGECPFAVNDGNEWWVVRLLMERNALFPV